MLTPKFIYVFDSLCSWCYEFDPQLKDVLDKYPLFGIQLLSGGMFSGDRKTRPSQIAPKAMVKPIYEGISQKGGQPISTKYTEGLVIQDDYYLDSDRTSTGFVVFKSFGFNGRQQLDFIFQTQQQMYINGVNPNSDEYYTNVLPNFDISPQEFLPKLQEPLFQHEAQNEMKKALELGVNAYPQLFLQIGDGDIYELSKGYTTADVVIQRVNAIIAELGIE